MSSFLFFLAFNSIAIFNASFLSEFMLVYKS